MKVENCVLVILALVALVALVLLFNGSATGAAAVKKDCKMYCASQACFEAASGSNQQCGVHVWTDRRSSGNCKRGIFLLAKADKLCKGVSDWAVWYWGGDYRSASNTRR